MYILLSESELLKHSHRFTGALLSNLEQAIVDHNCIQNNRTSPNVGIPPTLSTTLHHMPHGILVWRHSL